jgi:uncharacterized surface protein with fasciclin (FAS1) repeats
VSYCSYSAKFDALPDGLVECLFLEDNKDALISILTYHVARGQALSTGVSEMVWIYQHYNEKMLLLI